VSSEEIRDALKILCGERTVLPAGNNAAAGASTPESRPAARDSEVRANSWVDIPPYQVDVLVRGSESLAKTKDGHMARTVI
jgi:hypothetical protein